MSASCPCVTRIQGDAAAPRPSMSRTPRPERRPLREKTRPRAASTQSTQPHHLSKRPRMKGRRNLSSHTVATLGRTMAKGRPCAARKTTVRRTLSAPEPERADVPPTSWPIAQDARSSVAQLRSFSDSTAALVRVRTRDAVAQRRSMTARRTRAQTAARPPMGNRCAIRRSGPGGESWADTSAGARATLLPKCRDHMGRKGMAEIGR